MARPRGRQETGGWRAGETDGACDPYAVHDDAHPLGKRFGTSASIAARCTAELLRIEGDHLGSLRWFEIADRPCDDAARGRPPPPRLSRASD